MSEGRSKARGEERQGQCTRNEDMWTKEAERRKKEAGARQTAMGKRRHGETPTPSWARRDIEIEVGHQKPDGVILDTVEKMISYLSLPVHHFSNNSAFTPQTL